MIASYESTRLHFKRDMIDPLDQEDILEIRVVGEGTYRMTKRDFEHVFGHVTKTKHWGTRVRGFWYPRGKTPEKAEQFLV